MIEFIAITSAVTVIVAYAIGRHHGWMSAQVAWREQHAPLPSPSMENGE